MRLTPEATRKLSELGEYETRAIEMIISRVHHGQHHYGLLTPERLRGYCWPRERAEEYADGEVYYVFAEMLKRLETRPRRPSLLSGLRVALGF